MSVLWRTNGETNNLWNFPMDDRNVFLLCSWKDKIFHKRMMDEMTSSSHCLLSCKRQKTYIQYQYYWHRSVTNAAVPLSSPPLLFSLFKLIVSFYGQQLYCSGSVSGTLTLSAVVSCTLPAHQTTDTQSTESCFLRTYGGQNREIYIRIFATPSEIQICRISITGEKN